MISDVAKGIQGRDLRLDTLRALAIVLVLLRHLQPLKFSSGFPAQHMSFFHYQVTLVAVPIFYIVSLFLFYSHSLDNTTYLKRRLRRLSKLYVFWTIGQLAVYAVIVYLGLEHEPISVSRVILEGGPRLPYIGGSVFYFLFNLIPLTILALLYAKLSDRIKTPVGIAVILGSAIYFTLCSTRGVDIPYWRLDNFIVYIPIAYMLAHKGNRFRWYLCTSLVLSFFNCWGVFSSGDLYAQVSVVSGAVAIFCVVYYLNWGLKDRLTGFLGRFALGIFALHKYLKLLFVHVFDRAFSVFDIGTSVTIRCGNHCTQFNLINFAVAVFAVLATVALVLVMRRTRLREYVS